MMLMPSARPRICVGKISDATTNLRGPIEKAKLARNSDTVIRINIPGMFGMKKKIPVKIKLMAAAAVPTRYKGLRPS